MSHMYRYIAYPSLQLYYIMYIQPPPSHPPLPYKSTDCIVFHRLLVTSTTCPLFSTKPTTKPYQPNRSCSLCSSKCRLWVPPQPPIPPSPLLYDVHVQCTSRWYRKLGWHTSLNFFFSKLVNIVLSCLLPSWDQGCAWCGTDLGDLWNVSFWKFLFVLQLREVHESEMEKAYQLKAKIIEVQNSILEFCWAFIVKWYDDLITCASAEGHVIPTGSPLGAFTMWQVLCPLVCTFSLGEEHVKCTH